ncbi:hypothetical protein [Thioalkalivibrio sp. ALJ1]|uniref:hypothetical protein n=1 Tax=Thioalkalivibrio sp. ALJ1 TaxID=1158144 RepID=UPI0012E01861|nr:hypothetical protein [Thioalkalivibrio sp. ALJ1]
MESLTAKPREGLGMIDDMPLHPEFVKIRDGSRVVLLRESEFVQMLAALHQYEALREHLGGDPLVDGR